MMQVGLKRAAELTGKNQSTIHRAMKNGRISYTVGEDGERVIDVAELHRAFPVRTADEEEGIARKQAGSLQSNDTQVIELRAQLQIEQAKVAMLQERMTEKDSALSDLRTDRDHWRQQAERATLLLTDQRAKEPAPAPQRTEQAKGWRGLLHRLAG